MENDDEEPIKDKAPEYKQGSSDLIGYDDKNKEDDDEETPDINEVVKDTEKDDEVAGDKAADKVAEKAGDKDGGKSEEVPEKNESANASNVPVVEYFEVTPDGDLDDVASIAPVSNLAIPGNFI